MKEEIINRVQNSSLVTLDLEEFYIPGERVFIDMKQMLFEELILKERDFREHLKSMDWSIYSDKHLAIGCTADAIVPTWAYMLLTATLEPFAKTVIYGSLGSLEVYLFQKSINNIDWNKFRSAKVVVKGCSKIAVPTEIYVEVTLRLKGVASSIMYGEACSTIPLFKKPK